MTQDTLLERYPTAMALLRRWDLERLSAELKDVFREVLLEVHPDCDYRGVD